MKKCYFLFLFILFSFNIFSQEFIWSSYLDGNKDVDIRGIITDSKDNIYTAISFGGSLNIFGDELQASGTSDILLVKTSTDGELIWYQHIAGKGTNAPQEIVISKSDEIFLLGTFQDSLFFYESDTLVSTGNFDTFMAKYDVEGQLQFAKNIIFSDDNSLQVSLCMDIDKSGSIMIGGYYSNKAFFDGGLLSGNGYNTDFIAKFNNDGEYIWSKNLLGKSSGNRIYKVKGSDDGYYFAGVFKDSLFLDVDTLVSINNSSDAFIYKTNFNGIGQWVRLMKGSGSETFNGLTLDDENNVYAIGYHNSLDFSIDSISNQISTKQYIFYGGTDIFLIKYNPQGSLIWGQSFGGVANDFGMDICIANQISYITGQFSDYIVFSNDTLYSNGTLDPAAFISRLSLNGEYLKSKVINGEGNYQDIGKFVTTNSISQVIVGGVSLSNTLSIGDSIYTKQTPGFKSYFLAKYGCLPITLSNSNLQEPNCFGGTDAIINIEGTGGFSQNLLYSINNGTTYQDSGAFHNLAAGDYKIMMMDSVGCVDSTDIITITQPDQLEITSVDSVDVSAYQAEDGEVIVDAAGGTTPYTFTLNGDNPQDNGTYTGLPVGKYLVALDDANNCGPVETDSITISGPNTIAKFDGGTLRVYPNPTHGELYIEMAGIRDRNLTLVPD